MNKIEKWKGMQYHRKLQESEQKIFMFYTNREVREVVKRNVSYTHKYIYGLNISKEPNEEYYHFKL